MYLHMLFSGIVYYTKLVIRSKISMVSFFMFKNCDDEGQLKELFISLSPFYKEQKTKKTGDSIGNTKTDFLRGMPAYKQKEHHIDD